ncbi:MAG: hypothetical protein R3B90_19795 [Planctomycetaceae bacterium]
MAVVLGGAGVVVVGLADGAIEVDVMGDEGPQLTGRPALFLTNEFEVLDELFDFAVGLEARGVTDDGLSAGILVEDEQAKLVGLLEGVAGFVDGLPGTRPVALKASMPQASSWRLLSSTAFVVP